jgi:hypothetical protein
VTSGATETWPLSAMASKVLGESAKPKRRFGLRAVSHSIVDAWMMADGVLELILRGAYGLDLRSGETDEAEPWIVPDDPPETSSLPESVAAVEDRLRMVLPAEGASPTELQRLIEQFLPGESGPRPAFDVLWRDLAQEELVERGLVEMKAMRVLGPTKADFAVRTPLGEEWFQRIIDWGREASAALESMSVDATRELTRICGEAGAAVLMFAPAKRQAIGARMWGAGSIGGFDFTRLEQIDPAVEKALYWKWHHSATA